MRHDCSDAVVLGAFGIHTHHNCTATGRVVVVRVAQLAAVSPSLDLSVVADLSAPLLLKDDADAHTLASPTLLRWHPSLPAQLFIARGARVFLVDLSGMHGDGCG